MIRINLLPVRQVRRAQASRRQLSILAIALAVQLGAMFLLYEGKESEVESVQRNVSVLQGEIDRLKGEVGDFDKLRGQRDRLLKQRSVINQLHKNRSGPVWMLREISDILTEGKGPTVDEGSYEQLVRRDPLAGFNPRWNPRRLWIQAVSQKGKDVVIVGRAKDHDDVAELLKRLQLSKFFTAVKLKKDEQVRDGRLRMKVVQFSLICKLKLKA